MSTTNTTTNIDQLLQLALDINENNRNEGMNSLNSLAETNLSLFLQQL